MVPYLITVWISDHRIYLVSQQDMVNLHFLHLFSVIFWASLVAQMIKDQPTMQETWIQSLG